MLHPDPRHVKSTKGLAHSLGILVWTGPTQTLQYWLPRWRLASPK